MADVVFYFYSNLVSNGSLVRKPATDVLRASLIKVTGRPNVRVEFTSEMSGATFKRNVYLVFVDDELWGMLTDRFQGIVDIEKTVEDKDNFSCLQKALYKAFGVTHICDKTGVHGGGKIIFFQEN